MFFEYLTGSQELSGMRANDMMEHWAESENWEEVDMYKAHKLANEGEIVMVGWHSQSAESGHVAVVVPSDNMVDSKNWECPVPMTMDTGEGNRWASDRLSQGFGADKKPRIKFYRYKGPIRK